eukprot:1845479-Rhodomonas_salina.1
MQEGKDSAAASRDRVVAAAGYCSTLAGQLVASMWSDCHEQGWEGRPWGGVGGGDSCRRKAGVEDSQEIQDASSGALGEGALCPPSGHSGVWEENGRIRGLLMQHVPTVEFADLLEIPQWGRHKARQCAVCLFQAVAGLHDCGLIHGDIKPANVL